MTPERWEWIDARRAHISNIEFVDYLRIQLSTPRGDVALRIAGPVELDPPARPERQAEESRWRVPDDELARLLGEQVNGLTAADDGTLFIGLGRTTVRVDPQADYEAWELDGSDGTTSVFAVCSLGGLSVCEGEAAPRSRPLRDDG